MSNRMKIWTICLALFFLLGLVILVNLNEIALSVANFLFERIYQTKTIYADLDGDKRTELIKLVKKYEYYDGDVMSDYVLYILRNKTGKWEQILQDRFLGIDILDYKVKDINRDGYFEFVSWWADGNAVGLRIYGWDGKNCRELFWGGGKDAKVADINNDGIEEIFEYFRDYDKPFETYVANMHKWDGKRYVLVKEGIPVGIDPKHGDRLILGKGKIAVLK